MPVENDLEKKWHTNDNKCRFVSILGSILEPKSVKNQKKTYQKKSTKKVKKTVPKPKSTPPSTGCAYPTLLRYRFQNKEVNILLRRVLSFNTQEGQRPPRIGTLRGSARGSRGGNPGEDFFSK